MWKDEEPEMTPEEAKTLVQPLDRVVAIGLGVILTLLLGGIAWAAGWFSPIAWSGGLQ